MKLPQAPTFLLSVLVGLISLFSPDTVYAQEAWQTVTTEQKAVKRHENAFVKVGDKLYLLGGRGIKPVAIFDPATEEWSEGASAPVEFSHFQAVNYHGFIYVVGALVGGWPSETPLSHILIYDPLQDIWMIGPMIPAHRQRGAAGAVVYNDKIYLVCGIINGHTSGWVPWFDVYDPKTNTWEELPNAPRARDHFQAALVGDQLVVAGGRRSGYQGQGFEATIAETDVFDFNTESWRTLPSPAGDIPTQRAGCAATTVGNEVIVIGGESGSQVAAHAEVEALNIESGSWRALPRLERGRHGTQVTMVEDALYIAAGCGNRGGSPELNSLEKLRLEGGSSVPNEPLTAGRLSASADSYVFESATDGSSKTLTLSHGEGNQGILIPYIVPTHSAFTVEFPYDLPYLLTPSSSVSLQIRFTPQGGDTQKGAILIKTAASGKSQPMEITLTGN